MPLRAFYCGQVRKPPVDTLCLTRICHEACRHLAQLQQTDPSIGPDPLAYRVRSRGGPDCMALYLTGARGERRELTVGAARDYLTELRERSGL